MRLANVALLSILLVLCASPAFAAVTTSSFDGATFAYSYTITPDPDEAIRSFKVYTSLSEADATHYHEQIMPAGWMFDVVCDAEKCAITFWTTGDPLPAGQIAEFGYVHYCAPCCHSWYVSDEGNSNIAANVVDDDEQHTEPCNIPAAFAGSCGGPGLLLAPIYPNAVPDEGSVWGAFKALYR